MVTCTGSDTNGFESAEDSLTVNVVSGATVTNTTDAISTGNLTLLDLPATGKDQVAVLARAFNRMRRSLEKAMKMMEE